MSGGAGRGGGLGAAGADGEPPAPGSGLLGGGGGPVPAHRPLRAQPGGDRPPSGPLPAGGGQQAAAAAAARLRAAVFAGKRLDGAPCTGAAAAGDGGAAAGGGAGILPAQDECGRRRGLHRGSAAPPAGDASQGPYYLHHQGCPAVPQQRGSGPAPDAPGGSQRRLGPSGYRRGDPSDHPYSQ